MITYNKYGDAIEISDTEVCDNAQYVFTNGQCHAFAYIASEQMNRPIFSSNQITHMAVIGRDGRLFDIEGWHDPEDFIAEYRLGPDTTSLDELGVVCQTTLEAMEQADRLGYQPPDLAAAEHVLALLSETAEAA